MCALYSLCVHTFEFLCVYVCVCVCVCVFICALADLGSLIHTVPMNPLLPPPHTKTCSTLTNTVLTLEHP